MHLILYVSAFSLFSDYLYICGFCLHFSSLSLSLIFEFFLISLMFYIYIYLRLVKLLTDRTITWGVLFLMGLNMTLVRILCSLTTLIWLTICLYHLIFFWVISNNSVFYSVVTQYLMSILEMGSLFVSCPTIDQVFFFLVLFSCGWL